MMSDVDIKYKNQVIASMDASGTKTLETDGTYCEDDIVVEYTKPSGVDVSGVTATAADVLSPKKFVNSSGELVTGGIQTKTSANLTQSGATITAPAGYYATSASKSVPTETKTVTPSRNSQDVTPSTNKLLSKVTVQGDTNLVSSNIKSGTSIFGVTGTYRSPNTFEIHTITPTDRYSLVEIYYSAHNVYPDAVAIIMPELNYGGVISAFGTITNGSISGRYEVAEVENMSTGSGWVTALTSRYGDVSDFIMYIGNSSLTVCGGSFTPLQSSKDYKVILMWD